MYHEAIINSISVEKESNLPIINLETNSHILPIVIGFNEAAAIGMGLEKKEFIRPLTHDLMVNLINGFGYELEGIYIYKLEESTFYAKLRFVQLQIEQSIKKIVEIDCRPSDAMALCVRLNKKIFIEESVLNMAGIPKA